MDYYGIGQRIRRYRKERGMSQETLAERIDISVTHMSHIETGNTKLSLPVLVGIAKVLEVRTDDLLDDCLPNAEEGYMEEIESILSGCGEKEIKVIIDIIKSAKQSLKRHM